MRYMLFSLGLYVAVSGCANGKPKPADAPAPIHQATTPTSQQCVQLYLRGLKLGVQEALDPNKQYPPEVLEEAVENLHQQFVESGKAKAVLAYCLTELNTQQVECMMQANTLAAMSVCEASGK